LFAEGWERGLERLRTKEPCIFDGFVTAGASEGFRRLTCIAAVSRPEFAKTPKG